MTGPTADYQKGYNAGIKSKKLELSAIQEQRSEERYDRIFIGCLDNVLRNCSNWELSGKPMNNAEQYVKLAKIFADHSLKIL